MSNEIKAEELEEVERLDREATPGPWEIEAEEGRTLAPHVAAQLKQDRESRHG